MSPTPTPPSPAPLHAFLAQLRLVIEDRTAFGLAEAWAMPVLTWRAPNGFPPTPFRPLPHPLLVTGPGVPANARVERIDGRHRGRRNRPGQRSFTLQPAGVGASFAGTGPIEFSQLHLDPALLLAVAEDLGQGGRVPQMRDDRVFATDPELIAATDAYRARAVDQVAPPGRLEMDARAVVIVATLLRRHADLAPRPPARGGLAPAALRRVTEAMRADLARTWSLAELAELAGLSPFHFCRAFRDSTGQPPQQWLAARRLERMCELLGDPRQPLAEVAAATGYASPAAMAAAFRRATGRAPSAWRRGV